MYDNNDKENLARLRPVGPCALDEESRNKTKFKLRKVYLWCSGIITGTLTLYDFGIFDI